MSEETGTNAPTTIDLSQPRVIVLTGRHGTYKLTCRLVTKEDWAAYFALIVVGSKRDGQDQVNTLDLQTPRLALAARVITAAEGYKVDGGADLTSLPSWQELLPLEHRLAVGDILSSARAYSPDDGMIYPDGDPVLVDCTWGANADGVMQRVIGLKHIMRTPTEAQHRRYMREASRTRILGGDRTGETLYPGAQMLLAELYDELVLSVDGYCKSGEAITTPADIKECMDIHHKVMVAQKIFQPGDPVFAKTKGDAK